MHCFSGDLAMARECARRGYHLSFSGTVTFKNAKGLHAAARLCPAGQYLVETDAPFLTPHPFRGRPNEPYCAAYTVRHLAALRGEAVHEVAESVRTTAERIYRLPSVTSG
jgi:TatD DNase family protein